MDKKKWIQTSTKTRHCHPPLTHKPLVCCVCQKCVSIIFFFFATKTSVTPPPPLIARLRKGCESTRRAETHPSLLVHKLLVKRFVSLFFERPVVLSICFAYLGRRERKKIKKKKRKIAVCLQNGCCSPTTKKLQPDRATITSNWNFGMLLQPREFQTSETSE